MVLFRLGWWCHLTLPGLGRFFCGELYLEGYTSKLKAAGESSPKMHGGFVRPG